MNLLLRLAAAFVLLAAAPARADVIVGVAGPMSGSFLAIGDEIRAGAAAAAADINAAGGIGGEPVRIEVVEDKCAAETGAAVANQLVGMGARLVVGHACTAAALPAANVYAENGIVLISPAATNPRLTDERVGPGVFRMASRSDRQPQAIAAHLLSAYAGKRVGFVHDGSVYGQGLVDAARAAFEAGGGEAVMTETFTAGEKSQITLAGQIQDAALSVVVMGALQADAAVIAREVRDRGLTADLIGGEPVALEEFIALAGPAGEGVRFAVPRDWRREPGAGPVLDRIRASGVEPGSTALLAYAAVQAYAAAAEGDTDFAAVARRLAEETIPTAIGPVRFDAKGDLEGADWEIGVWRAGRPEPLP